MKHVMKFFIVIGICASVTWMVSCTKSTTGESTGTLKFSLNLGEQLKSLSLVDTLGSDSTTNYSAIVTISDSHGSIVYSLKKLSIYKFGGQYVSESLNLAIGTYNLTEFMISKGSSVVYATPLTGSGRAQLINYPLPIVFQIADNSSTLVKPEVLNTASISPQEFGYSSFSFSVIETLSFKIIAYGSSSDTTNAVQASLRINLTSFSDSIHGHDTISFVYKTLNYNLAPAINTIEVNKVQKYELIVTKSGYTGWSRNYTQGQLANFKTNPLKVYLTKVTLIDSVKYTTGK
jgi:hypothetical protein